MGTGGSDPTDILNNSRFGPRKLSLSPVKIVKKVLLSESDRTLL